MVSGQASGNAERIGGLEVALQPLDGNDAIEARVARLPRFAQPPEPIGATIS